MLQEKRVVVSMVQLARKSARPEARARGNNRATKQGGSPGEAVGAPRCAEHVAAVEHSHGVVLLGVADNG